MMLNAQKLSNKVQFTRIALCHPGIIMSIPSLKQPPTLPAMPERAKQQLQKQAAQF